MTQKELKSLLDEKVEAFNKLDFIPNDPISIPHAYSKVQDIEITAFWTAILAWGQRKTIINKANELFALMDGAPYDFIVNHEEKDRQRFENFKHRTFNSTDTLYFLDFLQRHYRSFDTLEDAFLDKGKFENVSTSLDHFRQYFFDSPYAPHRTGKHIASPAKKSTCKRLNMFLRWMVREDKKGVDFGIWKRIKTSALMIPYDVHVERVAHKLKLIDRKQRDWKAVTDLTAQLSNFDREDPVKYDFALFGMGVEAEF